MKRITISLIIACFLLTVSNCKRVRAVKKPSAKNEKTTEKVKVKLNADEHIFPSIDNKLLLKRLFDNPAFDAKGTALWRPNYYERMSYPVSYDGKCHTAVDTTMYFDDRQNRHCAVVILTTYNYRRSEDDSTINIGDCHFCGVPLGIALFSKNDTGKWELYKFAKEFTSLGYFGTYRTGRQDAGKINLKKIGDSWTCLSLIQGVGGNMGESSGNETLYSIERYHLGGFPNEVLSEILNYNYYYEMLNNVDKVKEKQTITMNILKRKKSYYDIDLIVNKNGKVSTQHLKYSDDYGRYIEK